MKSSFWIQTIAVVSGLITLFACTRTNEQRREELPEETHTEWKQLPEETASLPVEKNIKVLVVPCSNGYTYELHEGTVDPILEDLLRKQPGIDLVSFPYKQMKGSGYFGVYDKKDCSKILERTDADFLIMTRMSGGGEQILADSTDNRNLGYETRILNVRSGKQFPGISGKKLVSMAAMKADVSGKQDQLVKELQDSYRELLTE